MNVRKIVAILGTIVVLLSAGCASTGLEPRLQPYGHLLNISRHRLEAEAEGALDSLNIDRAASFPSLSRAPCKLVRTDNGYFLGAFDKREGAFTDSIYLGKTPKESLAKLVLVRDVMKEQRQAAIVQSLNQAAVMNAYLGTAPSAPYAALPAVPHVPNIDASDVIGLTPEQTMNVMQMGQGSDWSRSAQPSTPYAALPAIPSPRYEVPAANSSSAPVSLGWHYIYTKPLRDGWLYWWDNSGHRGYLTRDGTGHEYAVRDMSGNTIGDLLALPSGTGDRYRLYRFRSR